MTELVISIKSSLISLCRHTRLRGGQARNALRDVHPVPDSRTGSRNVHQASTGPIPLLEQPCHKGDYVHRRFTNNHTPGCHLSSGLCQGIWPMRSLARAKPSASLPRGSHRAAVLTPALGSLPEVNDGVLGRVLRQIRSPRSEHAFDLVPPGTQHALRQLLAHVKPTPEPNQHAVVGERGIASVLAEQRFLLGRGPEHDAVRPLHNYATIVTTLPDYRRARNVTNESGLQRTVTNHKPKRLGARGKQ